MVPDVRTMWMVVATTALLFGFLEVWAGYSGRRDSSMMDRRRRVLRAAGRRRRRDRHRDRRADRRALAVTEFEPLGSIADSHGQHRRGPPRRRAGSHRGDRACGCGDVPGQERRPRRCRACRGRRVTPEFSARTSPTPGRRRDRPGSPRHRRSAVRRSATGTADRCWCSP